MTPSFTRPNLAQLRQMGRGYLSATLPGADLTLRRSNLGVVSDLFAGFINGVYGYLDWIIQQFFPDSAGAYYIGRWMAIFGLAVAQATQATGNAIFTGTLGANIPSGTLVQDSLGFQFATTASGIIGGGSNATVAIQAVLGGSAGNDPPNAPLTLVNAVAGINATANVDSNGLSGGTDAMSVAQQQAAVLQRMRQPPQGGTVDDYEGWVIDNYPGVTRCWALPLNRGPGTIDVSFVMDGRSNIIPLGADLTAVQLIVNARRPVTDDCVVFAPTAQPVNFTIHGVLSQYQAAVSAALAALMATTAIGQGLSFEDQIDPAVAGAAGNSAFSITSPSSDVAGSTGVLLTLGTVTFT